MIGAFFGIINRPNDLELRTKIAIEGNKEDIEKSILYYKKDGITLRFNQVGFKTKYYGKVGGLGTLKERMPSIIKNTQMLLEEYGEYGNLKIRKNGIHEFVLKKKEACRKTNNIPIVGEPVNPEMFSILYGMLDNIKLNYVRDMNNRRGFDPHFCGVFGLTRRRFSGVIGPSVMTQTYPEIWEELKTIGDAIVPFPFNAVHVNECVVCPKHRDSKNVGVSLVVSFGDYTGCKLMVEGVEYDTDCRPVIFNGAELEHWNTKDLQGKKYSLVFYNCPYKVND
jgi:hypothetical protein